MKMLYLGIKRSLDVLLCAAALIVLSPVFLLTAVAIKLEDGGSVLYVQKRVGKGEKEFDMYKFRSMRTDADQLHKRLAQETGCSDVSFKLRDDPRVTRVGRFIRRTSIDELPQLINILKNEMSIVGPRPLPSYEYQEEKARYGAAYQERYGVKQGLTCYWQVEGRGEDMPFDQRMEQDVRYAREANLLTDLRIMVRTFGVVISGKGAY